MKDIRLKTSQIPVIEKCKFDSNENSILHLLGPEAAKKDLSEFERYKFEEDENLKKLTSFKEVVGFGCKFYYQLMIFHKEKDQVHGNRIRYSCRERGRSSFTEICSFVKR